VQGVDFAIPSVPKPCGGACAVDLHKYLSLPVLLARFEAHAHNAYPAGDGRAAILPTMPANSRVSEGA